MQTILILLVFLTIILVALFVYKRRSTNQSNAIRKKSDIEQNYINILKTKQSKEDKISFIKQCNSELSRNIFFTKQEADSLIQRLIQL
jgi:predicted negative regulator of RcsB-dependent stress response